MWTVLFGFCAGAATACGYFALITSLGMINRFAQFTRTADKIYMYETMLILGAIIGNILVLFNPGIYTGLWIVIAAMFFTGIFIGSLLISLAEHLKGFPVLVRRTGLIMGLKIIILIFALGKMVGSIFYFLYCKP